MVDRNCNDLLAGIFQLAVMDDIKLCKGNIYSILTNKGVTKSLVHKYIDKQSKYIDTKTRENVYKEALKYPNNSKSETYNNIKKLVNELVKAYK